MKNKENNPGDSKEFKVYCVFCEKYYILNPDHFEQFIKDGWKTITFNYDQTYYICPKHNIQLKDLI